MNTVLDRVYLAMDAALRAIEDGCDCGCTDAAKAGLVDAMRDLETMTTLPRRDQSCCGGSCTDC